MSLLTCLLDLLFGKAEEFEFTGSTKPEREADR